jgi:signal peptidase I
LIALVAALVLRTFVVQAFYIPSSSMVPTLRGGDRVLVNKLVYTFGDMKRFDIVVFEDPSGGEDRGPFSAFLEWLTGGLGLSRPAREDFIKRVVAFEGETWEIRDGRLYVDGRRVPEPYVKRPLDTRSFPARVVPDGMLAVLGDNRLVSEDSRFELGYVAEDEVVGKAFLIVWPPSRVAWLGGA